MKIDRKFAEEFDASLPRSSLLRALAHIIVASVMSLDGLLFGSVFLFALSLGGYLTVWLPGFAWICLMLASGCLIVAALLLVVIAASFSDANDDGYPES